MAEKLSIQIALEGGAEVEKGLANIGEAGKKASADLSSSFGGATADKLATSFEQAGQAATSFAQATKSIAGLGNSTAEALTNAAAAAQKFGATSNELAGLETVIRSLGARARDSGTSFAELATNYDKARSSAANLAPAVASTGDAAAAVGVALTKLVGVVALVGPAIVSAMTAAVTATIAFADAVNKVNDQAIKLGQPIEKVDQFRAALEKAGVSAQSIGQILSSKLASEQGVAGLEAFIRQLEQMPDSAARSAAAFREFGAAGAELIRILQAGGQLTGLKVGPILSAEDAKRATQLGVAINQLESSLGRFNTLAFAPALTVGINAATNAVGILGQRLEQTPWTTFWNAASLGRPITSLISTIAGAINALHPPIQQVGIATQQASGLFTQWGASADQAGQKVTQVGQQATGMFTSYGTVVGEVTQKTQTFGQSLAGIAWDTISGGVAAWNAIIGVVQEAGAAISNFVSSITGITWDTISSGATTAWNAVVTAVQGAGTAITDFVSKIGTITWDIISGAGVAAWNALTGAIQSAIDKLLKFIGIKPSSGAPGGEGAPGKARGGLLGGRGTGTSDSNLAWVSRGEHIMPASVVRRPGVLAFLEALRRGGSIPGFAAGGSVGRQPTQEKIDTTFAQIMEQLSNAINPIIDKLLEIADENLKSAQSMFDPLDNIAQQVAESAKNMARQVAESLGGVFQTLKGHAAQVAEALKSVAQSLAGVLTSMQGTLEKKAHGGLLGGRGSGTSDSNLAWVSRGEYITPARAVSQPGVLAFLEALRRSGGNLRAVLDGMGRFALGGMVPRMPAFAAGGLAGGSHVTIQFPGLPAIGGLRASADVVDQLHRAAALAQVRSGGRKPSRYS